jgi:hypothetical protein
MIKRPSPPGGVQKYSREVNETLGRLTKSYTVGRAPALQIAGLAAHIRSERFWNAITSEPDLQIRGMIIEAHAKAWAKLQRAAWRRQEPF